MKKSCNDSEKQLVREILEGNQKSARLLYNKYYKLTSHLLFLKINNKDEANDLSAIILNKAFEKLNTYSETYSFSAWFTKIRENTLKDYYKSSRKRFEDATSTVSSLNNQIEDNQSFEFKDVKSISPEDQLVRKDKYTFLYQAINKLSKDEKECIVLFYIKERSLEEISDELRKNENTVKTYLLRAKTKLREYIPNEFSYI